MNWTWYLFGFKGRINRAKYWLAGLVIVCLMIVFAGLTVAVGLLSLTDKTSFGFDIDDVFRILDPANWHRVAWAEVPSLFVKAIGTAVFLWIYLATSIKRLHDRDRSGRWIVPFFFIPGLYKQFSDRLPDSYLVLPLALIVVVLLVWGCIEMFFLSGSRKTNRFGANPLLPVETKPRWEQHREIEMVPHTASPPPVWRVKSGA